MNKTVKIPGAQLVNADSLQYVKTLPEDTFNLIITDPPYFRVKPHGWDNQWRGDADYLRWLHMYLAEFWRVLKPAGSLYLFCGHRLAADTEIMLRELFCVLNHIIWAKPGGHWNGCHKESLRAYFPATERILFAEHYQGPYRPKDSGYAKQAVELKQQILMPLINYFRGALKASGVTSQEIAEATGKQNMHRHWFGLSQWQLPGERDYLTLQALFSQKARERKGSYLLTEPHQQLSQSYAGLCRQYAELVDEYRSLRRPFTVSALVPYTDVWTYKPVQFYPGKHPCEKPADMLRDMICASSKPGDLIGDFFMGSGSTVKQALATGRHVVAVELEEARFDQTVSEVNDFIKTEN